MTFAEQKGQDNILVKRAKQGDISAFEELVGMYRKRIYYTAYQMTNCHADADDLSQEAFIRAYGVLETFDEQSSFHTWIYRIVVNLSINYLKKKGRYQHFPFDEEIIIDKRMPGSSNKSEDDPEQALENKELHQEITSAIDSLNLKQKKAIIFSLLQGLTHKEIAEIEDCSEGTISWRIFQARKKLIAKLRPYLNN